MVVTAGMAAYHNSFGGPFVYDDVTSIQRNQTIRRLWPPGPVLRPPCDGETVGGRPLLNLSFAVNYVLGGLDVRGYHATNLAIHIAAALLLFGILRQTFLTPPLRDRFGKAALPLALACALIWIVHPLHTESVTYIVQRAESLTGLFYLLTLYCVIRGAGAGTVPFFAAHQPAPPNTAPGEKGDCPPGQRPGRIQRARCPRSMFRDRPLLWYAAAVLACLCGMATKEVMVTAPLVVLLYDRTFLAGSLKEALRRRWGLYLGLAATWGLLAYLLFSTRLVFRQEEMGSPSAWQYARTQPGVILYYLRLSLWPKPLCFDYAWPVANSFWEIVPGASVLAALWAATLWGLVRRRAWGFPGAWFLLILAPTSSILPLGQLAFEHRMYLALGAVVVLAVAGGYALWDRLVSRGERGQSPFLPEAMAGGIGWRAAKKGTVSGLTMLLRWAVPVAAWAAVAVALGCATAARNLDYSSAVAIYQDTVDKRPDNPTAHFSLGSALAAEGRTAEAIEHYQQVLRLFPDYPKAHYNWGNALVRLGKTEEAVEHYREALRLKPDYPEAHHSLGYAFALLGRINDAIDQYQQALRLKPDYAEVHNALGVASASVGRMDEAIEQYQQALRLKADDPLLHKKLGAALVAVKRTAEAIAHYQEALRLKADDAQLHHQLGDILFSLGRADQAIQHYREALQLRPDYAEVHNNLGALLAAAGKADEAAEQYREALRLKPDYAEVHNNLGALLAMVGKTDEAAEHYREALRLKPDYADAEYNLGLALMAAGKTPEAIEHHRQFLRRMPNSVKVLSQLAWVLATGDPAQGGEADEAVQVAERARELAGPQDVQCLDTLAAAYAAAGRFAEAISTAEQAVQLAESTGQAPLAKAIQARLELFRAGRPYREAPRSTGP